MNDAPRQKLREILDEYGPDIIANPRRCKALLLDYCGKYRREIFVLVAAQEEKIANDLHEIRNGIPLSVLVAQLTQRLMDNRAMAKDAARWAVESWALALDINIDDLLQSQPSAPEPAVLSQTEPAEPRPTPTKQQTQFMTAQPDAHWRVKVFGRDQSQPSAPWENLGTTPQKIKIPPGYVLGLRTINIKTQEIAAWVASLPNQQLVTSLDLSTKVDDSGLAALQNFPNLTYLEIDNAEPASDTGISYLAHHKALTSLNLAWCTNITDEGLSHLRPLKNLINLSLSWCPITDAALKYLDSFMHLSTLTLRECKRLTGSGLKHLRRIPGLNILDLTGNHKINDMGLLAIGKLIHLTKLELSRCKQISNQGLSHLQPLALLSTLDLSRNENIGDQGLTYLHHLHSLSNLNLSHTNLTNTGLTHIKRLSELTYLDISANEHITDRGLMHLQSLSNLAYLNLSRCKRITQRGIDKLNNPKLYISQ